MSLKKSTIRSTKSTKPKAAKSKHYVDNEKLYDALKARKESGNTAVSNYIGDQFLNIAKNLAEIRQFRRYQYKEDMIMEGVASCVRYIDNFDHEKFKNPFAYFTQICSYAFIGVIRKEKKFLYIKFKSSSNAIAQGQVAEIQTGDDQFIGSIVSNLAVSQEYINEFIDDYEKANKTKTSSKKTKKSPTPSIDNIF